MGLEAGSGSEGWEEARRCSGLSQGWFCLPTKLFQLQGINSYKEGI